MTEARANSAGPEKAAYAQRHDPAGLADVIGGADLFLGLAGPAS